jgi:NAD-reducing hydrogenase large subunit
MSFELETAANTQGLRRVAIDPVSRVEGHGKVTLLLDENNQVQQARLHIVEFRGFEKFIEGRPYWEVPVMVQRLCGICPVSHHLAASKAFDRVLGATPITASAEAVRRLMHYGQMLQSHALHFFHLSSPDLLFGFSSDVAQRNIVGVAQAHPEVAKKGILLRKFGQEIIRITSGKRVHGTGAVPGGVNKLVTVQERDSLKQDLSQMLQWAQDSVDIAKQLHAQSDAMYRNFGSFRSNLMSLVRADGAMDLYDGVLRVRDANGVILFDGVDDQNYLDLIEEEVRSWSYMKFPHLRSLGREQGWYRVGPLARVQNCDFIPSPDTVLDFVIIIS